MNFNVFVVLFILKWWCCIFSQGNYEIVKAPDEYTIQVESNRGNKEFQFDHIFLAGSTQEEIFEDTNVSNIVHVMYYETASTTTYTKLVQHGEWIARDDTVQVILDF